MRWAKPASEVPRLFEPFQRLGAARTGRGPGWGLGLAIVRAIATAHGAAVAARPRPDGGLEIEVTFPASPDPGDSPDRGRERSDLPPSSPYREAPPPPATAWPG